MLLSKSFQVIRFLNQYHMIVKVKTTLNETHNVISCTYSSIKLMRSPHRH